jgi:hypothetical protein
MAEIESYHLAVYVPTSHVSAVKDALFAAGAGKTALYDRACWESAGTGQFRPLRGAKPYLGNVNQVCSVPEIKIEMICAASCLDAVLAALRAAHPYEEPAILVVALSSLAAPT